MNMSQETRESGMCTGLFMSITYENTSPVYPLLRIRLSVACTLYSPISSSEYAWCGMLQASILSMSMRWS